MVMDAEKWVAVAFFVFMVLAIKLVFPKIIMMLDARSAKIGAAIAEAQKLKNEAENLFIEAEKKFKEAQKSAKEMLAEAKKEAAQIAINAEKEIEEEIARKISLAEQKISRAENDAIIKIRRKAIEAATESAKEAITKEISKDKNKDKVIAKSVRAISRIA